MVGVQEKDTDKGGGKDGQNCAYRNGSLGILQIPRPVGASHNAYKKERQQERTGKALALNVRAVRNIQLKHLQTFSVSI